MSAPFRIRDYRSDDFPAVEVLWRAVGMAAPQRGDSSEVIERTLHVDQARPWAIMRCISCELADAAGPR